ncbi:MAG: DUF4175 family protein, partial [Rhodospirillales bacterium]|nr:DUF4175 family protein [Rhodospirillales bacterium]
SAAAGFVLPAPAFRNPLARAVFRIRQGLSRAPDQRAAAADAIASLLGQTTAFAHQLGAWLELRLDAQRLVRPAPLPPTARVAAIQQSLWRVARHLEDASRSPTARALAQARRNLRAALERALRHPDAANRQALEDRLRQLQRAIAARLQALQRELAQDGVTLPRANAATRRLNRMADAARRAAAQGDMRAAAAEIASLERLLDQLRDPKALAAQARREMAARQQAQQEQEAVTSLIQREGHLLDHAHQRLQQAETPASRPSGATAGPAAGPATQRAADAAEQQALQDRLDRLTRELRAHLGQAPPGFDRAHRAMAAAAAALAAGQDRPAQAAEQAAIAALQQGGKGLGQALAKQFGRGAGPQGPGGQGGGGLGLALPGTGQGWLPGFGGPDEDPLGRQDGQPGGGLDPLMQMAIPADASAGHTRRIEQELRRRQGQRARPQEELDYIERLLKQF